jgi:3-isopropylmalate/(R)-2-methylmalate dehydratase small subunit
VNDITAVIAPSFARIFRQNMYNCGMLALELPAAAIEHLFKAYAGKETTMAIDIAAGAIRVEADSASGTIPFSLQGFDAALVQAGGWLEYADSKY